MALFVSALALLIALAALWLASAAMRKFSTEAHGLLQQSRADRSTVMKEVNDKLAELEAKVETAAKGAETFAKERQEITTKMETLYREMADIQGTLAAMADRRTRAR